MLWRVKHIMKRQGIGATYPATAQAGDVEHKYPLIQWTVSYIWKVSEYDKTRLKISDEETPQEK